MAIVGSLAAKLTVDRSSYPRVWARTLPIDPDLPIRGRYVRLRVEAALADAGDIPALEVLQEAERTGAMRTFSVRLSAEQGALVARRVDRIDGHYARVRVRDGRPVAEIMTPVAFFIPEHAADPSIRQPGEELWVELTVPPTGPPRPIQLGVRTGENLTPLDLR
jgi:hypothetical protein